jgi:hypothetical protein
MQVFTFNPHLIHLFVTVFLTLFLKVFNLQGKDASRSVYIFCGCYRCRTFIPSRFPLIYGRSAYSRCLLYLSETLLLERPVYIDCGCCKFAPIQ